MAVSIARPTHSPRRVSGYFVLVALACLWFADLEVSTGSPLAELAAMGQGFLAPTVSDWQALAQALLYTTAFALQAIALAAVLGFAMALGYRHRPVRLVAALLRSVHEVFWALLFIQLLGLSSLAGLLALLLPYTGTLAKIYGEQWAEADRQPALAISDGGRISRFFYTELPLVWAPMVHYTSYRLECALRSSVVLGFIGLPTLGFALETALRQGQYNEAAAFIYALIALVVSLKFWLRPWLLALALPASFYFVPIDWHWAPGLLGPFAESLIPAPWRLGLSEAQASHWWQQLWAQSLLPGTFNTLLVAQIALVITGLLSLAWLPLNSRHFGNRGLRACGDGLLIVLRTLPEYLLNFLGLILLGPSMLPAIIAMGLHNGAIIAHLLGGHSSQLPEPCFAARGLNRYGFYVLPQLYRQFMAYVLYRWEIIMRETAMLGVLGVPTLGFYIDSAFELLQFDRALLLIAASSLLTLGADALAYRLRTHLALHAQPERD
ncbi:ABC transporter permease [Simiduia sp. 21SJ11W-1]|uniref:PhnE/PtxC family ABC transporter permease n=1 Tax=Simiduia sp. 21SJ11W-1 TaxID=2909669 RepID=UPI0020A1F107|nr:ABC transporter permease [Simiduia sp. 21SJ11W-1]UTA48195.1 ABC transporter permease [Simiduia sp. 21SJ11W-1]